MSVPDWLAPVAEGAAAITVHELTRFMPPEDSDARRGAVLILFADVDGDGRGELLLTERAHHMRSHPGQVSFPGGTIDPGETPVEAAVREAEEEIGLDPAEIEVFGELPELWLPPSNFAVTPILGYWRHRGEVSVVSPDEVHAIHHVVIDDLLDPAHPDQRASPVRLARPGVPDRARARRHPVGLHGRDHRPALRLRRVVERVGHRSGA
ncbi:NUDIX hydrolase [Nocardioides sp. B-3]|uniref:NUDIX hydrolase n=1 Tax=Nocardioides sp. B-3 TaxID=2895565 RepID=UPI002153A657|nr:CoA pyrophosphatase [Nocardioides sp. B-3]UUZ60869.1 CoA pyrophosphatase [Nocardioides sp. B-3]